MKRLYIIIANIILCLSLYAQEAIVVGEIYDALLNQYADKDDPETLKNLNMLCVRGSSALSRNLSS